MRLSTSSSSIAQAGGEARRLTAADRPGIAQPVPERPVPSLPWRAILPSALALAVFLLGGWEWYWRDYGAQPYYRDDSALWAIQRRRIDVTDTDATVLVAASRILFDLQLPVWERVSGRRPIQLALPGTSPLFALEDLADDLKFKGRVLVGVAPDVFFSGFEYRRGFLRYFEKESPSQRVSKWLSMRLVEPYVAFYDQDFALFTVLKRQPWPLRPGREGRMVPRKLGNTDADRNTRMWSKLETDSAYRDMYRHIWDEDFHDPPPTPAEAAENQQALSTQIARAATAVEKLRRRHIPVLFVRAPSSGAYLEFERRDYPREKTWDALLAATGAPGINFEDYPQLQGFDLPDWSHLAAADADRFTAELYQIIDREYGQTQGVRW